MSDISTDPTDPTDPTGGSGGSSSGMTPIIAVRTLTRTLPDGSQTTLTVNIGQPTPTPPGNTGSDPNSNSGPWYCTVQIVGMYTTDPVIFTYGEDAVTALMMALYHPGVILSALPYASEIDYSQFPNFLFPVPPIDSIMASVTTVGGGTSG